MVTIRHGLINVKRTFIRVWITALYTLNLLKRSNNKPKVTFQILRHSNQSQRNQRIEIYYVEEPKNANSIAPTLNSNQSVFTLTSN